MRNLGQSGSTLAGRNGFRRLVAQVSLNAVGAVLCLQASRLARNNRDWHHLIDLCGLVGALLIDPEGVYDPRFSNDRLLLGLKGTMSEYELTLFRQRSHEARHQKAVRGELRFLIPVGFQWSVEGGLDKCADLRIQQAHDMVFAKFRELGSARQSLLWMREQQISLPKRRGRRLDAELVWALPRLRNGSEHVEQPHLCGCLRLWPNGLAHQHRRRACSHHARSSQAALGVEGVDPGPSSWLHHVGRIRAESEDFGGQCEHERTHGQGRASSWRRFARRATSLWPLRAQAPRALLRQTGRGFLAMSECR